MSSTYSPILRSELIGAGDQAGTWGNTTNSNFQYVFEAAIAGYVAVTVSPTLNNQVLTYVNGPSASASLDQSIYALLKLNAGSLGANFNIFAPPVSKTYVIWNNTAYTATFYNSTVIGNTTPGGSGAVIPAGAKVLIWSDGTSFYGVDTVLGNFNVAGNLSVAGSTALTGNLTGSTATFSGAISSVSPSFTGTPTAPTAAGGTNTTQIATTAFVTSVVNTLGTMATQNANAVNITGGTLTGMTNVAGGTHSGTTATYSGVIKSTANATSSSPSTFALQGNGSFGGGLSFTDGSYGIGLYSSTGTLNFALGSNTSISPVATLTLGGVFSATQFNGSGAGLTGTAASLSIGGNAATATNATNATTATNANQFQGKTKLGLGITGETWHDVTGSRSQGVPYPNSNAYPISVSICFSTNNDQSWSFYVDGVRLGFLQEHQDFNGAWMGGIVPPGGTYIFYGNYMSSWSELY